MLRVSDVLKKQPAKWRIFEVVPSLHTLAYTVLIQSLPFIRPVLIMILPYFSDKTFALLGSQDRCRWFDFTVWHKAFCTSVLIPCLKRELFLRLLFWQCSTPHVRALRRLSSRFTPSPRGEGLIWFRFYTQKNWSSRLAWTEITHWFLIWGAYIFFPGSQLLYQGFTISCLAPHINCSQNFCRIIHLTSLKPKHSIND